ncbi:sensor histidine kinase [Dethiothermospora halolimnae]|uniref:sensor histidine kinase n=1 Tax=Dethiothermospora halolimnae TaxID=3114390 RepID=UPI003CCC417F
MKNIIKKYLKDNIAKTLLYFSNTFIIILFFYLYTDGKVPIKYPLIVSFFIYFLFISIPLYRYIKFNKSIRKSIDNPNYGIEVDTYEREEVLRVITAIHSQYNKKIYKLKNQMKDSTKFFSQWVHNMKTPLSVIGLIIQKIEDKKDYDDELIMEFKRENSRLNDNLEQILNLIRIEDFSTDYTPEVVNLYDSLKQVINDERSNFIYSKVYPKILFSKEDVYILTDKKWNQFMLKQIISNGIKYSRGEKGKNIFFDIEKKDKYIYFSIEDQGIGIPFYDLDRVFEPFFTGENGRKYKNSSGIGLYICSVIADKLGQELTIDSKEGEGTTVKIRYLSKM